VCNLVNEEPGKAVQSEPSEQDLRDELAAVQAMTDAKIDTSDIREVTDWSGAVCGRFYRPVK